jgi:triphosphoribosyl-dephospho-CoA synthase
MNRLALLPGQIAALVEDVCELDVRAFKPGNVSFASPGHGMTAAHFVRSAKAIAEPLTRDGATVGERILDSVTATRAAVQCNTNLGIILLLAPLVQAALRPVPITGLRARLEPILRGLSVDDAEKAFTAIRLAAPGGLGESTQHDVRGPASADLGTAMQHAAGHDQIARQYATGYESVFDFGVPLAELALRRHEGENWAAVDVFLGLLGQWPDTHIVRKHGLEIANAVCLEARRIRAKFVATSPEAAMPLLLDLDASLKNRGINPGTSADLTVTIFVAVRLQEALDKIANDPPANLAGGICPPRAFAREFHQPL